MSQKNIIFGQSVHFDIHHIQKDVDEKLLDQFVKNFIEIINMKIEDNFIWKKNYIGRDENTSGWTYLLPLTTSSFSLHHSPKLNRMYIDIFSCSDIPMGVAKACIKLYFGDVTFDRAALMTRT